jgi:hypothetical protein
VFNWQIIISAIIMTIDYDTRKCDTISQTVKESPWQDLPEDDYPIQYRGGYETSGVSYQIVEYYQGAVKTFELLRLQTVEDKLKGHEPYIFQPALERMKCPKS